MQVVSFIPLAVQSTRPMFMLIYLGKRILSLHRLLRQLPLLRQRARFLSKQCDIPWFSRLVYNTDPTFLLLSPSRHPMLPKQSMLLSAFLITSRVVAAIPIKAVLEVSVALDGGSFYFDCRISIALLLPPGHFPAVILETILNNPPGPSAATVPEQTISNAALHRHDSALGEPDRIYPSFPSLCLPDLIAGNPGLILLSQQSRPIDTPLSLIDGIETVIGLTTSQIGIRTCLARLRRKAEKNVVPSPTASSLLQFFYGNVSVIYTA